MSFNVICFYSCVLGIRFASMINSSDTCVPLVVCKTGTVGTLASQAEIGVWVQALGTLLLGFGRIIPGNNCEIVYPKSCNLVHFGWKMVCIAVRNALLNTLTMVSVCPHVLRQNDPRCVRRVNSLARSS